MPGARVDPLPAFQFTVEIDGIAVGSFSEVSGLESETVVIEYRNGNDLTTRKLPGLHKVGNIVLKRGVTRDRDLWNWRKAVLDGNVERRNGSIVLLDGKRQEMVRWNFFEGWPRKWVGPTLDARTSEVAIETLEIAVERLELAS
jgi:phage tail-like protein